MNSTIHERPGVYSSYDASSVVSASAAAKTIGAAAVATKGTANKVELITSYEEGKSVFGEDASGVYGMSTLLKFLFANGAGAVKAVAVGKDESEEKDYASAFAALSDEEDVGVMVCDSAAQSVHLLLKTAAEDASAARRERIAVIGGSEETVAQMVNRAKAVNSERVVLVGPDIASDDGGTMSAVFAAAAVLVGFGLGLTPPRPVRRALAWLSALTYSFYLWHQQLTLFLKYDLHLPVWSGDTPPNQLGDTAWMQQAHALYWTAAIAVTLAAYYGVEKPIAKRLHGKKG